ncbi:hypothetical protein ACE1ET_07190 [Saccharicrinis sp. FJH62]|uniref:hypothetical protein n=1 Tax=Saccharicrinis sp. FJH62 TaxID=3344657 RepID=UPI0035D488FC
MNDTFVFQTDSIVTKKIYDNNSNYLVDKSANPQNRSERYCILYFSSNDIYYPNTEEAFLSQLVKKDRYEWYKLRINKGSKHIFIRDIKKQWYLEGINKETDSIEKVLELLKKETKGYRIITMGSSAGGFAAVLFGSMLDAETILTFNGQFFISDLLNTSSESINPTVFRQQNNPEINKYYSLRSFIKSPERVYYFYSDRSKWDINQHNHVRDLGLNVIPFRTSHHGIPFLKSNLKYVLNLGTEQLNKMVNHVQHPILFSFKVEGIFGTVSSILQQTKKVLIRKLFNKM